jgi:hypothetical protein
MIRPNYCMTLNRSGRDAGPSRSWAVARTGACAALAVQNSTAAGGLPVTVGHAGHYPVDANGRGIGGPEGWQHATIRAEDPLAPGQYVARDLHDEVGAGLPEGCVLYSARAINDSGGIVCFACQGDDDAGGPWYIYVLDRN